MAMNNEVLNKFKSFKKTPYKSITSINKVKSFGFWLADRKNKLSSNELSWIKDSPEIRMLKKIINDDF